MRAMVLDHPADVRSRPLRLRDVRTPSPGPDQVRVKVAVCGVCRTDLHVVEGELPMVRTPIVPGHEVVGFADAVGPKVRDVKEGDRVGVAWLQGTCGRCEWCRDDRENLCAQTLFTGYHVDGGYAEYVLAQGTFVYPLPAQLTDEETAPLLCAGIIGYRAFQLSGIHPGQRLGLYGFGASAHITIQLAHHWGCAVYVCSLREEHRALARELGAVWVGDAAEAPPDKLHGAILFAPAGELVPPALRALEKGGTLAVAGIHLSPIPSFDYADLFGERVLRSVTANTRQDALEFLQEAAAIPIRSRTAPYRLDQANDALLALKAGRIRGAAVLRVNDER
jgi:propanol-preferring alcohol dehydrogenase